MKIQEEKKKRKRSTLEKEKEVDSREVDGSEKKKKRKKEEGGEGRILEKEGFYVCFLGLLVMTLTCAVGCKGFLHHLLSQAIF